MVTRLARRSKAFKVRGKEMKLRRLVYSLTVSLSILATVRGDNNPEPSEYCTNEKCTIAAGAILRSQNRSVNPCNDFYTHACTGQKGSHFFYTNIKIYREIAELFKNVQSDDMEALKKAKKFQDACMNEGNFTERQSLTRIQRILADNGEWPITVPSDKWNSQHLSWKEIHENFAKRVGISALFDVTVEIDRNNTSKHILSLGVPTVPSERALIVAPMKRGKRSTTDYQQYFDEAVDKMKKLRGFDVKDDDVLADYQGIIAFEDKIEKLAILWDEDAEENVDDLRITSIDALQNDWDAVVPRTPNYSINWLNVITDRFEGTGVVIDASQKIALKPAAFIANFASVLVNTPERTIVNYIHWRVVDNLIPWTHTDLWNPHVHPIVVPINWVQHCIIDHKMIHAVSYMYAKRHLSVESKTAALEMLQNIGDEIKREIDETSWMDKATKSVAREKMDAMTYFVGFLEWYDEPGKLDQYYREYTVGPDYFENVMAYNKFETKMRLSKLRNPVDKSDTEWTMSLPYFAAAEYLQQSNSLNVPPAILRSPFFVYGRPSVLNYGSLGAIAGHEIAHGFDAKGRLYDQAGNKRKWWSQSAIDTYKAKAQCFVEQYDKYTVDINNTTVHVNGTETLLENIADTMGFRASLRAYQRLKNDGKISNVKIQQLNHFTDEQLYFYELVYTFCAPGRVQSIETGNLNAHSPRRQRINGPLSNMQEFADAFHCPLGSSMNPREKCLIWD